MARSEENLQVGTETVEAGRTRLRKHVVTEQQRVTVPVTCEEVTLECQPIAEVDRNEAYDGPPISEEEHEVTLHAKRPVVDVEAIAVKRVRLGKQTVTEQETVGGEVRKEQIELDGPGPTEWFNGAKGFGFISVDGGGADVFVLYSEIDADGYRSLDEGQRVEFEIGHGASSDELPVSNRV